MQTVLSAVSASALVLILAATSFSQERRSEITATYLGLNQPPVAIPLNPPKNAFAYRYQNRDAWLKKIGRSVIAAEGTSPAVGVLDWTVPVGEFGSAGLDRNFRTFCSEAPVPVTPGNAYRFEIKSPAVPEAYQLGDTEEGKAEAYRRSLYIRELFGLYYIPSLTDLRAAKAFQISLWELIHETPWVADKPAPLDLDKGNFTAAPEQTDPESVNLAREYLKSLTGNDNVYYENPDLAGRELVWMKGLVSPQTNNAVAQSQFGLQYVQGGGVNASNAVSTGVPLGGGSGGAFGGGALGGGALGGGGAGAFAGGGGGGLAGGGGGGGAPFGTNVPPTGPPDTTTPPTSGVPPVNSPPIGTPTTTNTPPTVTPTTTSTPPTTPVPAPGGIVLAAVALGAVIGRRALKSRSA